MRTDECSFCALISSLLKENPFVVGNRTMLQANQSSTTVHIWLISTIAMKLDTLSIWTWLSYLSIKRKWHTFQLTLPLSLLHLALILSHTFTRFTNVCLIGIRIYEEVNDWREQCKCLSKFELKMSQSIEAYHI